MKGGCEMFLSLEEEGLLSKWMMIAGILIAIGAFLIELVMGFLQGGVFWAMRLSLMDILWCFGWFFNYSRIILYG